MIKEMSIQSELMLLNATVESFNYNNDSYIKIQNECSADLIISHTEDMLHDLENL